MTYSKAGGNIAEERQKNIAVSLGLEADYFEKKEPSLKTTKLTGGQITKIDVNDAAKLLQMNHNTVRKGLQQGVFPWGYAIHTSENRWCYFINAMRFYEIEGITIASVRN